MKLRTYIFTCTGASESVSNTSLPTPAFSLTCDSASVGFNLVDPITNVTGGPLIGPGATFSWECSKFKAERGEVMNLNNVKIKGSPLDLVHVIYEEPGD